MNLDEVLTQAEIAEAIGISQQTVSDLERRGICHRGMTLLQWWRTYTNHLREKAAGRATDGNMDLATERAALARSQRERIQMANGITAGNLVDRKRVELAAAYAGRMLRDSILSVPTKIAHELGALADPWEIDRRITAALRQALDDAARISATDLLKVLGESNTTIPTN